MIFVDGNDDLAIATGGEPLPVSGRYRHTPLGVQTDFGGPSEHVSPMAAEFALLARYSGWLPISSHFYPLFHTIGKAACERQQARSISCCSTGT